MRREQLSQLQWDNPNICTTARWPIPVCDPNGQHDKERVPTQLISKPTPLISSLLLGVRTDVCEFKIAETQSLAWITSQDYLGLSAFPNSMSFLALHPQAFLGAEAEPRDWGDHRQELE